MTRSKRVRRDMPGNIITPEMEDRQHQVEALMAAGETFSTAMELVYGLSKLCIYPERWLATLVADKETKH